MQDIDKMDTHDLVSYWTGRVLVAIGEGTLRGAIFEIISHYQTEAYARGVEAGKAMKKKRPVKR